MKWKTLIAQEVWECDSILLESDVDLLLEEMKRSNVKILNGQQNRLVSSGYYNYNLHSWGLRNEDSYRGLRSHIFGQLNTLFTRIGVERFASETCNPVQIFAKSFNASSHYELHTEPSRLFGDFAFVIYLQDEEEGALNFIEESRVGTLFESTTHSPLAWQENVEFLRADGQSVRFVGPQRILPRRNLCVVFRTGSAHFVEPISSPTFSDRLIRPCLSGWPFAYGFEKHLQV